MNRLDSNNAIFQHDNAAIHTSRLTKDWFKTKILKFWNGPLTFQIQTHEKICGEFCQEEYTKIKVSLKIEKL